MEEKVKVKTIVKVKKYRNVQEFLENKPYADEQSEENIILNEGANIVWTLVCGGVATPFNNANARLGVGDSNASEQQTHGGLLGANQCYKSMDIGYPTYGTLRKMNFKSTFGTDDGNFHWQEFTVDNGETDGVNLNRKLADHGTKTIGQVWTCELIFTLA